MDRVRSSRAGRAALLLALAALSAAGAPPALRDAALYRLGDDAVLRLAFDAPPRPESVRVLLASAGADGAPPGRAAFLIDGLRCFARAPGAGDGDWDAVSGVAAVADDRVLWVLVPPPAAAPSLYWAVETAGGPGRAVRRPADGWIETALRHAPELPAVADAAPPPGDFPLAPVRSLSVRMAADAAETAARPWKPRPPAGALAWRMRRGDDPLPLRLLLRPAGAAGAVAAEPAAADECEGTLRLTGAAAGVAWRLYLWSEPNGDLVVTGDLESDREQRVEAAIECDLPGGPWTWHDDLTARRPIGAGPEVLRNAVPFPAGSRREQSRHPIGVADSAGGTVTLEVDPTEPRLFRIEAAGAPSRLRAAFDLGLTPMTALFPGRATFAVTLRARPTGGDDAFRRAWSEFQRRHAELFERRIAAFGLPLAEGAAVTADIEDLRPTWSSDRAARERLWPTTPFEVRWPVDATADDPAAEALRRLRFFAACDRGPVGRGARAAVLGGARHADGSLALRLDGEEAVVAVSAAPGLLTTPSAPQNRAMLEWAAIRAATEGGGYAGVTVRGAGAPGVFDTNRAALAAAQFPATYRPESDELGAYGPIAAFEYLVPLADALRARNLRLAVELPLEAAHPFLAWPADLLIERWPRAGTPVEVSPTAAAMNVRRALAGRKPVAWRLDEDFGAWTERDLRAWLDDCLLLGFLPGPGAAPDGRSYWSVPAWAERDLPLWRTRLPWIVRLAEAGWTPEGAVATGTPGWRVESFGNGKPVVLFTARRGAGAPADGEINLAFEGEGLLIDPLTGACEPLRAAEGRATARIRAPAGGTALRVAVPWNSIAGEAAWVRDWNAGGGEARATLVNLRGIVADRDAETRSAVAAGAPGRYELRIENLGAMPAVVADPRWTLGSRVQSLSAGTRILGPGERAVYEIAPEPAAPAGAWLEVRWRLQRGDREWDSARALRPSDAAPVPEPVPPPPATP